MKANGTIRLKNKVCEPKIVIVHFSFFCIYYVLPILNHIYNTSISYPYFPQALSNHDISHLTCCRTDAKISPTSCDSHLKCKPRFHIDDSQSELKVTCTLFASKRIRAKPIHNESHSKRNTRNEEIYIVTNFIVYDRHYNRKMNSAQSRTTKTGASLMNFIVEVQWYVCLKDKIHQQIVLNDVRRNLFGSSDEEVPIF